MCDEYIKTLDQCEFKISITKLYYYFYKKIILRQ
jgi:hypothetical protein